MKFQISVRELMLVVFVIGLASAGLATGGWLVWLIVMLLFTTSTALAIVACVGRGRRRVFAVGYLIAWLFYIVPHAYVGSSELDPYGKLPTTRIWQSVFQQLVKVQYVNLFTGQPVPDYDPTVNPAPGSGTMGPAVTVKESLDRSTFMLLAHALGAAALAYAGGKFAQTVNGPEAEPNTSNA